ncbi:MAG TPA: hypothetical protein VNC16_11295 [Solirubrobacterales bacterium]|nr:hypothetical protein [Solirubrobacterales bacterium]
MSGGRRPDLDFSTSVKAKEVTFGKVPKRRKLTYYGEPDHKTDAVVERENIPEEPEEGVTYRDVKVDWSVAQWVVHPAEDEDFEAEDVAREVEERRRREAEAEAD